ncbi:MAG: hypothetical protein ACRDWA_06585 [Acidimicrobiia bacterium]
MDPVDLAVRIADVFERLHIPYVLGGSLASSLLGEPRSTNDVDLAVALLVQPINELVQTLAGEFYIEESSVREAVRHRTSFNVIHLGSMLKADIFVLGDKLLDRRQIERRRRVVVVEEPLATLWVTSAEDQVLRKLCWFRDGGEVSDRQWRDIVGLLAVQVDQLDRHDLDEVSKTLGVNDLLARAWDEVAAF